MALIVGAISGVEIVNKTFTNDGKEEHVVAGVFQFQTKSPDEYWTVNVTPDQVEAGLLKELEALQTPEDSWSSKPVHLNVRQKQTSFNGTNYFKFEIHSIPKNQKTA